MDEHHERRSAAGEESTDPVRGPALTSSQEVKAVACNYARATRACAAGAKAYVLDPNGHNASDRIKVVARSRSGRWVRKWEDARNLGTFRVVTLVQAEIRPFEAVTTRGPFWASAVQRQGWCDYMNAGGWAASPYNAAQTTAKRPGPESR